MQESSPRSQPRGPLVIPPAFLLYKNPLPASCFAPSIELCFRATTRTVVCSALSRRREIEMGKKKGGNHCGEEKKEENKARTFVLKVAMHCNCDGCNDKIRAAVKDITRLQGIESWDQSALETKGELKLVATADPEKLRQRLHKATRKNVDLIFPKDNKDGGSSSKGGNKQAPGSGSGTNDTQTQLLNLNLNSLLQHNASGWNTHGDYPWQQPDPYAAYSASGGAWGGYAYPPAQGYGGAWHGLGY